MADTGGGNAPPQQPQQPQPLGNQMVIQEMPPEEAQGRTRVNCPEPGSKDMLSILNKMSMTLDPPKQVWTFPPQPLRKYLSIFHRTIRATGKS